MSEQELNKVERETFLNAARDAGLTVTEQSAYAKLTFADSPAKIYIARTSKVTRVDLSGFTVEHDGINQVSRDEAKALKLGAVQAQLDFTQEEDAVLEAFTAACEALKVVPPKPKKVKKPKVEVEAATEETETTEETDATASEEETVAIKDNDVTDFGSEFETTEPNHAQV